MATPAIVVLYHAVIFGVLVVGLGGVPNYIRFYAVEYGRRHPVFGAVVWSFELIWASLLFFLSFSALVGVHVGIGDRAGRWGAVGSLGGVGVVALFGAGVSALAHCGVGAFGMLLAVTGISAVTIEWFGYAEPVLIPAGYTLMALAIVARVRGLGEAGPVA